MTRPPYLAGAAIVALFAVGVVASREGDTLTIASETSSPWATAATVPDSLATGNAPAEVESGTRIATHEGAPDEAVTDEAGGTVYSGALPISGGGITGVTTVEGAPADLAVVDTPAERRQNFVQVGTTVVPALPTPGDCASWVPVFEGYGATADEVAFFVPRIIERESGCGRDTLNDRTGDTGVCQINPVHNRAGWFGRVEYGDGGWLAALHGLRTWHDTDSPVWVDACLTLYRVCGPGAWRPPYSCANRPI